MTVDEQHLRRAIRLAMNGRGRVEPNPMVGCVIANPAGHVIGEGCHEAFGGPHAEPNALDRCTESPAGATAYVTLEPCFHTAKKTPPCAPRLIAAGVARVVVGCLDPNPAVNGGGLRMLREAGVQVDGPVLEAECKQLIAPFLKFINSWPAYLTLKWAESADGCVAGGGGRRVQISNPAASHVVQQIRSRSNGILVGINTVLKDDPTLLPRGLPIPDQYRRFILDTHLRTPADSRLVRTASQSEVVVLCAWNAGRLHPERKQALVDCGIRIGDDIATDEAGRLDICEWYFGNIAVEGMSHLLVEPGPTLATTMLPLANRLWVIRSPNRIDEATAPHAAAVPEHYVATRTLDLDGDRLTEYLNTRGNVYFASVPSADLVLAGSDLPAGG